MKVVINVCFGGFSISRAAAEHMAAAGSARARLEVLENDAELEAFEFYKKHKRMPEGSETKFRESMFEIGVRYDSPPKLHGYGYVDGLDGAYERNDPLLVAAVEALGDAANGEHARLRVVEIPDGVDYEISEYDGREHIAEAHRTWS